MSWIRTAETIWWRTAETLLGVSFETYLRRHGDVLMRRRHYVPLRRGHDLPIRRREDVPLRRLDDVPMRRHGCFIWDVSAMSLGHTKRRRYDVATTSCCRVGEFLILQYFIKSFRTSILLNFFLQKDFFTASFCSYYMCLTILKTSQCFLVAALLKFKNLSAICRFGEKVFPLFYQNAFELSRYMILNYLMTNYYKNFKIV